MRVKNVWITGRPHGNVLANVAIELEIGPYRIQILGLRLVRSPKRICLAMPSRKTKRGWEDIVYPCDQQTRDFIEKRVLYEFQQLEQKL